MRGERLGLKLLERVAEMALDIAAVRVFLLYGIDPLEAVPLEHFRTTTALHKVRWPQILAEVTRKRESMRKLTADALRRIPSMNTHALEQIETKIAFLERANAELSDVVFRQHREIETLRAQVVGLAAGSTRRNRIPECAHRRKNDLLTTEQR